jgi:hypothetical protein
MPPKLLLMRFEVVRGFQKVGTNMNFGNTRLNKGLDGGPNTKLDPGLDKDFRRMYGKKYWTNGILS